MSADVWIESPPCPACGHGDPGAELNITYNLSRMLREAGFIGWGELEGMNAQAAGTHILGVLDGMAANPDRWRAMNPPNGWGDYDSCIQGRMREWAQECKAAPEGSVIGASL